MAAPVTNVMRDEHGRFTVDKAKIKDIKDKAQLRKVVQSIVVEHNYVTGHTHDNIKGCEECCPGVSRLIYSKKIETLDWGKGRRIVELKCLVNSLSHCLICRMGPLVLTSERIKGETKMGLGGYLYVQCSNCGQLNTVPYGSTYSEPSKRGQRIFTVNTKLGAGKCISLLFNGNVYKL